MPSNKVAVVTGSNSGLGKEIALFLAAEGFNLVISGRDKKTLESVKKEIGKNKVSSIVVEGDITKKETRENLLSSAMKLGHPDILVNNAGILLEKPFEETSEEEIENTMDINAISHIKLAKLFYSQMKKQKSGKIVNIVSINAINPRENITIYGAAKGAMKSFTETLRFEANRHGIQVFGVYPGGMKTGLFEKAGLQKDTSKLMDPKEVAETIISVIKSQKESTSDIFFTGRNSS